MSQLEVSGLFKEFKARVVVDGVDFSINGGEIVGLLGPNGAGKTTTFYMVVGLVRPNQGKIVLDGRDITDLPMYKRARAGLSYLPQEPSIFRRLTVTENILIALEARGLTAAERQKRLESLLNEFDIQRLKDSYGYMLSGGERRRVEIARALAGSPNFLLLDEPFAGIDPIAVADIQAIVLALKAKGLGVLITDHNVRETLGICDRAFIMKDGKVMVSGSPEEISASSAAREAYLGEKFTL